MKQKLHNVVRVKFRFIDLFEKNVVRQFKTFKLDY